MSADTQDPTGTTAIATRDGLPDDSAPTMNPLKEKEARALVGKINLRTHQLYAHLLELYERQGWKALGYANFALCAKTELEISTQTAYRWIQIAKEQREGGALPTATTPALASGTAPMDLTPRPETGAFPAPAPTPPRGPGRPLGSKNRATAVPKPESNGRGRQSVGADLWRTPLRDLETAELGLSANVGQLVAAIGPTQATAYATRLETLITELGLRRTALLEAITAFEEANGGTTEIEVGEAEELESVAVD